MNDKYENRYDVTLLINGLPLVQIELKRHSVEMSQAFQQILRYRRESFNVGGSLFRYLQIFVISNGMSSRYFSNNDGELNKNFIFNWSDENNRWIDEIEPFTASFLSPLNIHEMISKYTIFDADQKVMKIMRPYQVYAQKSIMSQAEIHPLQTGMFGIQPVLARQSQLLKPHLSWHFIQTHRKLFFLLIDVIWIRRQLIILMPIYQGVRMDNRQLIVQIIRPF